MGRIVLFVHVAAVSHARKDLRIVRVLFQSQIGLTDSFGEGEMKPKEAYGEVQKQVQKGCYSTNKGGVNEYFDNVILIFY